MKLARIRNPEERGGSTVAYLVSYDEGDFDAASTTETITLDSLVSGDKVRTGQCAIYCKTAIAGGSISAVTAELGVDGDTDRLIDPVSVFTGDADKAYAQTVAADNLTYTPNAAKSLLLTLSFTGGNSSTATAGELIVLVALDRGSDILDDLQF